MTAFAQVTERLNPDAQQPWDWSDPTMVIPTALIVLGVVAWYLWGWIRVRR